MRLLTKWIAGTLTLALVLGMVGCATQRRPESQPDMRSRTHPITYRTPATAPNNVTNLRVANNVANAVSRLKEINSAVVFLTDRTAYVAVVLEKDYRAGLTGRLKSKVAKQVRRIDPSVRTVYVSANPDFVNRMRNYARDVQQGHPIAGLIDNFRKMIQRTFPTAR
ncbi:YhcN/YlaJ family sporulation lipoprotein [Polycladomyces subterraneus]|uniref:YhcN/YlaJ family sporulation lipoprotein n=1 Tax=Polycladomyces subterraneus TaxID=1016997 RepID=A0ABT8IPY6_9BACL|nr:YhcN/YlaJ family sporulation lipoprotein [Polycladomyces subterraneus]MDN4594848.1 YhcN/YlaJ family sporulation lipoprotein [Polycladomyces subterraneus]